MKKLNVAVIFGGCSSEYKVSLESAYAVIQNMDKEKYIPVMVGITQKGKWFYFHGDVEKIANDTWCNPFDCIPAIFLPNRGARQFLLFRMGETEAIGIDAALPILHGKNGEDGTVQGLIELSGIPLVGCGILPSALCMDKYRAHKLVQSEGISAPKGFVVRSREEDVRALVLKEKMNFPLFIKPLKAGSSHGISKVEDMNAVDHAVALAFKYDEEIIVEEGIDGFEVGCAVMDNKSNLIVGELDEVELSGGFFNFTEKYTLETSTIYTPARISQKKSKEIKEIAKKIYQILGCQGFARVDMFLTLSGEIVFNEVNTIPGFTAHSRFPNMMKAAGMDFTQVISHVIDLAVGE